MTPMFSRATLTIGVLIFAVVLATGYHHFFVEPRKLKQEMHQRWQDQKMVDAGQNVSVKQTEKIIERTEKHTILDKEGDTYVRTIEAAPGAKEPVAGAVHDAGLAALRGLRKHDHGGRAPVGVQQVRPPQPGRADAGSARPR